MTTTKISDLSHGDTFRITEPIDSSPLLPTDTDLVYRGHLGDFNSTVMVAISTDSHSVPQPYYLLKNAEVTVPSADIEEEEEDEEPTESTDKFNPGDRVIITFNAPHWYGVTGTVEKKSDSGENYYRITDLSVDQDYVLFSGYFLEHRTDTDVPDAPTLKEEEEAADIEDVSPYADIKFKEGDRVTVTFNGDTQFGTPWQGVTGTVEELTVDGAGRPYYRLTDLSIDQDCVYFYGDSLEHIATETTDTDEYRTATVADLKDGDEFRYGHNSDTVFTVRTATNGNLYALLNGYRTRLPSPRYPVRIKTTDPGTADAVTGKFADLILDTNKLTVSNVGITFYADKIMHAESRAIDGNADTDTGTDTVNTVAGTALQSRKITDKLSKLNRLYRETREALLEFEEALTDDNQPEYNKDIASDLRTTLRVAYLPTLMSETNRWTDIHQARRNR